MDQPNATDHSESDLFEADGGSGPTSTRPSGPFIVGIGASAGGLEALERFFDSLPDATGMAFVVIQHLSPDFKSLMDELLARHTSLPIHLAENEMRVESDHVYLIPPRMEMIISGGRLLLSEREPQAELNLPIDTFFRSLARDCGTRAIGIVLSGGGSDGSRGIRDIREAGGLVLVQDTGSAQFDGMPKTAREAGVAHWVLAPQDMPHVLLEHVRRQREAEPSKPAGVGGENSPARSGIEAVYQLLEDQFGIDFTHYKPSTITRRIERRMALAQSPHVDEYLQRLRDDRGELDVLYRDLLIGVTHFFRDEEAFRILEERVLPELVQQEPRSEPLRIWVAGCATGEEAYSLAIALQDTMLKFGERPVKIFATDVHRGSLDRSARALYDAESLAHVSKERLERYFVRVGESYQVAPDVRRMIVFAQHNVMRDAPFTRVDLVTCRNLLIYLQLAAQAKVLSLFHFALKRGGRLFLGPSETVGPLVNEFSIVDKRWRLYRKETDARRLFEPVRTPTHPEPRYVQAAAAALPRHSAQLLGTYDAILEEVMPPGLLVNEAGELVHTFGGASRFLRLREGRQDLDIVDMVDADLRLVMVGGIKRAFEEPHPLLFRSVRQTCDGETRLYDVTLRRFRNRSSGQRHVLVSFQDGGDAAQAAPPPRPLTEVHMDQASSERVGALEAELAHTRENLQSAIEELETSNEELQAANEELQASNEELQSTNEELQSVNEELYTVNAEYQRKIAELTELTNDMDNLLASTEVGTVFLDRQLRIRKFTPQIAETFSLVSHDVGRPIETFASKLDYPGLVEELRHVLESAQPVERELRGRSGTVFYLRIFPYRAKGTIDGVVLTLIDATGLKAAEDALFHERHLLDSLLSNLPEAIYFKNRNGRFIRANGAMARRLGVDNAAALTGRGLDELPQPAIAREMHHHDEEILRTGEAQNYSLEQRPDGWDLVTRLPIRDANGQLVGTTAIFRDVTDQKRAEAEIREAVRRRDQFLAMLSHELRNPLSAIVTATGLLAKDGTSPQQRRQFLDVLSRQSQQMTRLLDELLEASRVTHNKIALKKEIVDLNAVVRDTLEAMRAQIESRGVNLATELSSVPVSVDGDAARLQQVLVNLLTNAAKYTQPGGHITVATQVPSDGSGMVELRVRDDGAGIANDLLSSVFELFVQSRRTLDRSAGGLGVGLSLVRSLVAMHGGKVTAHSDGEGKGSEFVVRLPLAGRETAVEGRADGADGQKKDGQIYGQLDGQADGHPEGDVGGSDGQTAISGHVVMVEDNTDSREMLCELLHVSGVDCTAFEGGPAALDALDRLRPFAAVIDLGLPGMDGFELARRIRALPAHNQMRLIALTGYGQPADRARSWQAGFDEHLVKPVRLDRLLAALRRHSKPGADSPPDEPADGVASHLSGRSDTQQV